MAKYRPDFQHLLKKGSILNFDLKAATIWGQVQALSEIQGKSMPVIAGQIAATGISYDFTVVTRNTKDMKISGVSLFNPWLIIMHNIK